jgi:hypothetical protein
MKVAQITLSLLYMTWRTGSLKHSRFVYDETAEIPRRTKELPNES